MTKVIPIVSPYGPEGYATAVADIKRAWKELKGLIRTHVPNAIEIEIPIAGNLDEAYKRIRASHFLKARNKLKKRSSKERI